VRCSYLARATERAGHHEAARRWQAKAVEWMGENPPDNNGTLKAENGTLKAERSLLTTEN